MVCIFICGCHCCKLGCISTSKVWEARILGQDIGRINIHARCFFYHCLVWAHQTTTETVWIGWIWVALSWPHIETTVRHVRLSGSAFTLNGSDTEIAWWDICLSGCFVNLGGFRPSLHILLRMHLLWLIWRRSQIAFSMLLIMRWHRSSWGSVQFMAWRQ